MLKFRKRPFKWISLRERSQPISVLRIIEFAEMTKTNVRLLRTVLCEVLLMDKEDEVKSIFQVHDGWIYHQLKNILSILVSIQNGLDRPLSVQWSKVSELHYSRKNCSSLSRVQFSVTVELLKYVSSIILFIKCQIECDQIKRFCQF